MKTLLAVALLVASTVAAAQTYQQPYYQQPTTINRPQQVNSGAQPVGPQYYQGQAPRINQLNSGGAVNTQQYYIQPNGSMATNPQPQQGGAQKFNW